MTIKWSAAIVIMQNPWFHSAERIAWAKAECEIERVKYCPHDYEECQHGCCYPGNCGKAAIDAALEEL